MHLQGGAQRGRCAASIATRSMLDAALTNALPIPSEKNYRNAHGVQDGLRILTIRITYLMPNVHTFSSLPIKILTTPPL